MRKRISVIVATSLAMAFSGAAAAHNATPTIGAVVARSSLPAPQAIAPASVPLTASGGPLIFSDAPEQFNVSANPGAFYRAAATGSFRVFWHHQNIGGSPAEVALVLTNTTATPEAVFSSGLGVAQSFYPDQAGQTALSQFFNSETGIHLLAKLAPQQSYWLTEPADMTSYNGKLYGNTVSGMAQFSVVTLPASRASGRDCCLSMPNPAHALQGLPVGKVMVTNLAYQGSVPSDPLAVPVLTNSGNTVRGTFPTFRRSGTVSIDLTRGPQSLAIESAVSGPYSSALPGEYQVGSDVADGTQVYDNGNYGVTYRLDFRFTHPGAYKSVTIYDVPAGGAGHYAVWIRHHVLDSPYLTYEDAWVVASHNIGSGTSIRLRTALPGGADGPQLFIIVPSPSPVTP